MHCWYINLLTHNFEPLDEMLNRWTERVFVGRNAKPLDEMLNRWTKRYSVGRNAIPLDEMLFRWTKPLRKLYGNRSVTVSVTFPLGFP